jgi:hypothetical protein
VYDALSSLDHGVSFQCGILGGKCIHFVSSALILQLPASLFAEQAMFITGKGFDDIITRVNISGPYAGYKLFILDNMREYRLNLQF